MGVYKRAGKKSFVARIAKKGMRKAGQAIKKRYYGGGKLNVSKLVSDVALVKRMLNAEKKTITNTISGQVFGQVLVNSSGFHSNDITPIPIQGNGASQRQGQSIKICSFHMSAQVIQQVSPNQPTNYKLYIFRIKGDPMTSPGTFAQEHWYTNPFVGGGGQIIDYNSQVNPNHFNDADLIYFKKFTVKGDTAANQIQFKSLSLGKKLNLHVRYDGDTNTVTQGQLYMFVMPDSGNCGATSSTLTNIPVGGPTTGATINYQLRWYYYDN